MVTFTFILVIGVILAIILVPIISFAIAMLDGMGLGSSEEVDSFTAIMLSTLFTLGVIPAIVLNYQYISGSVLIFPYVVVGIYCLLAYVVSLMGWFSRTTVDTMNRMTLIYNGYTLAVILPQT